MDDRDSDVIGSTSSAALRSLSVLMLGRCPRPCCCSRIHRARVQVEEMKEVFACFDKDSSGAVTTAELALVLKSMNKNYTEAELKKIIGKFDVNGTNTDRHGGT